jgi:transcriptional regulator with XRE-family HTH domain
MKMSIKKKDRPDLAKWLRKVRTDHELQQDEFAKAIGVSRSLIAMMENGERSVGLSTLRRVQEEFIDAPEPPMTGELRGFIPAIGVDRLGLIKYAGVVPCSTEWGDPLSGDDFRPIDYKFAAKNRFLCRVEGDSCSPALQPGDLTVWEIDGGPPYGVMVLAQREEDHCCTVKQYLGGDTLSEPVLRPLNKKHKSPKNDGGWRVVARLVGVIREDKPERTWFWSPGITPEMLL